MSNPHLHINEEYPLTKGSGKENPPNYVGRNPFNNGEFADGQCIQPHASNYEVGSLDFERVINQHSIQHIRRRFHRAAAVKTSLQNYTSLSLPRKTTERRWLLGFTGRTATRWALTVIASLLTGITAIGLVICTSSMVAWRSAILHEAVNNWEKSTYSYNKGRVFQSYLLTNLVLALLSSLLCVCWVPHAAGSGIPEVKAYLNGVRSMHKLANTPLFVVKVLGTILSVSSGLSVGQEGPLIHIGSIMGSSCTKIGGSLQNLLIRWNAGHPSGKRNIYHGNQKQQQDGEEQKSWTERLLRWTMEELSLFATDAERRDLVSIGASVGFAASFGAPIGGLLFILDDISCYFERHLLLRMLIGNAIGTFCLAIKHGNLSNYGIINMGDYETPDNNIFVTRLLETPLYILIGVGGGVLGGLFCAGYLWLRQNITSRFPPVGKGRAKFQLLEVAVVSVLTSAVMFYLPTVSWACKPIPSEVAALDIATKESKRFFCEHGEINEMATMMFGSRISAIKEILTDPSSYQQRTLLAVGGVFYVLTIITFGTCIPAGLFTPTILIGAALGGAAGNFFNQYINDEISPSTFALLGVASMLAGIQRSTVSVAVILVEGTGQLKVLLPVIIVVVVSRYVAQSLHTLGVFETVIEYKKLPYLEHEKIPRYFDAVTVKEVMSEPPLVCLEAHEKVSALVDLLDEYGHHSFPVVESGSQRFIGLVKRVQIAALLECGVFSKYKTVRSEDDLAAAACGFGINSKDGASAPIMYWAYCINDDRYAHIYALPEEEPSQFDTSPETGLNQRENNSPMNRSTRLLLTKNQKEISKSMRMSLMHMKGSSSLSWSLGDVPQEFCTVTRNEHGKVMISSMAPQYLEYWVDLAKICNLGTYTVTEFCPVSKAYSLFTSLGLSHIVVLGGNGEVVGVLSRASFLPKHIEEKSGF